MMHILKTYFVVFLLVFTIRIDLYAQANKKIDSYAQANKKIDKHPLLGSWIITTEVTSNFCGINGLTSDTYQFLISGNRNKTNVTVIGETSFPKLKGKYYNKTLHLKGRKWTNSNHTSEIVLSITKNNTLEGVKYIITKDRHGYSCLIIYKMEGKKQ